MTKKTTKNQLPKKIYVTLEPAGKDEEYLIADVGFDSFRAGASVSVYELVETKTKIVTHSIE